MTGRSGKFVLRIPEELHRLLTKEARLKNISLNSICEDLIQKGLSVSSPEEQEILRHAQQVAGIENLLGVVIYGSWARKDVRDSSDFDVLIVVRNEKKINRRLYQDWDLLNLKMDNKDVEANFVYLPSLEKSPAGIWAEIAIDGIVIYEKEFAVSRYLSFVRQNIADHKIQRFFSHGQPFWIVNDQKVG